MKARHCFSSIRNRILYLTFIYTAIIGIVISLVSYVIFQHNSYRNLNNSINTNLSYLANHLDSKLDSIDQLATYCQASSIITTYVENSTKDNSKRLRAYDVLSEYCQNNIYSKYLYRVVITSNSGDYIQSIATEYSSVANISEELPKQPFYNGILEKQMNYSYGFIIDPFYTGHVKRVLPLIKPISYKFSNDVGGYIFLEISTRIFTDSLKSYEGDIPGDLILTLGSHRYLYTDGSLTEITGKQDFDDNEEYIVITYPMQHKDCSVTHVMTRESSIADYSSFIPIMCWVFMALIVATLLINTTLNHTITKPVIEINKRLEMVGKGDFSRDTSIEWNHELGDIGRQVNDLAEAFKELLDSELQSEKQKRDLEYKVLQSQVNPHFLYNTLNSIKWMATTQGATGISEMTTSLARLLKSISKGTRLFIPIRDELALLEDYFTIQKYRYGGTLQLNIAVPDSIMDYLILKFTLQPIVENAIFHGIEPSGHEGIIEINATEDVDSIMISVKDNGVGMSEELINHVLNDGESNKSEFFREFGVSNIQQRIQYEYGDKYGISIESVEGEYTTMNILIPKEKEKMLYV